MESVQIEGIQPTIYEQQQTQIPIFDQDYWADEAKDIAKNKHCSLKQITEKTDVSQNLVNKIESQISNTQNRMFDKVKVGQCKPYKREQLKEKMTNPHNILKEGYIKKKTDGFIFVWHKRFIVLTPEKLISFQDERKQKAIGCINFKILPTQLHLSESSLVLDFQGECQNMILFSESTKELVQWKELIQKVLDFHGKQNKILLKTMNKFIYDQKDVLTEREFLKEAQTGDILLFYTENLGAKVQRFLTNSDYDHVAMVVKLKNKQLMIFESNQMHGVSLYEWKQYITYFNLYGKVTLRKLNYIRKAEAQANLLSFMKKNLGKKYEISALKLLKFQSDFNWQNVNQQRGYFCSQLIGKALKSIGLLDQKKSSGRYWPVDFAQKNSLALKKGAILGPEQTVLLNKHTKNII